jgi:putative intracellular protease/amidase
MVLTSHDKLGDTEKKTGVWLEEFAAPYYLLKDAGAAITLASPKGGQPALDPKSELPENLTESTKRFRTDNVARTEFANTKQLADMSADDFDAIFYPGGHGPMDVAAPKLRDATDATRIAPGSGQGEIAEPHLANITNCVEERFGKT